MLDPHAPVPGNQTWRRREFIIIPALRSCSIVEFPRELKNLIPAPSNRAYRSRASLIEGAF
jgi:hypothetical protein